MLVVHDASVNTWGPATFGDPCEICGFLWSTSDEDAQRFIVGTVERFTALIAERDGQVRHAALEWNVSGYVSHVADSLRVWAERLASVALRDPGPVAEYNQEELARARGYDAIGIKGALWSLRRAVGDWQAAVDLITRHQGTMTHAELGTMTLRDVVIIRAHDVHHHEFDIRRSLGIG
jgi:hypothetical protein